MLPAFLLRQRAVFCSSRDHPSFVCAITLVISDLFWLQGGSGPLSSWTFTSSHRVRGETWRHTEPVSIPLLSPKNCESLTHLVPVWVKITSCSPHGTWSFMYYASAQTSRILRFRNQLSFNWFLNRRIIKEITFLPLLCTVMHFCSVTFCSSLHIYKMTLDLPYYFCISIVIN